MAGNDNDELGRTDDYDENDTNGQNAPTPDSNPSSGSSGSSVSSGEQEPNTRFISNILYENNGSVYGFEVLLFDIDNTLIENIVVVDSTSFDAWTGYVEGLGKAYTPYTQQDVANLESIRQNKEKIGKYKEDGETLYTLADFNEFVDSLDDLSESEGGWSNFKRKGDLKTILKNEEEEVTLTDGTKVLEYPFEINATKFMGLASDEFSRVGHSHNFAPTNHSALDSAYGVGTNELYGHVKVINHLSSEANKTGEVLSAYQGHVLNDEINNLKNKNKWSTVIKPNDYISYKVNEDLRLVVCNYNRKDYTGLSSKTGEHILHKAGTIPDKYAPSGRTSIPMYRGDVVLYYKTDGSVNVYNLTKVKKMSLYGQVMWHY